MTLTPIHEGTLHACPVEHPRNGGLQGGRLNGGRDGGRLVGGGNPIHGDAEESPQLSAQAEINNLISSLGSLASQAGALPLQPPTLAAPPQNPAYQPQATDYSYNDPN